MHHYPEPTTARPVAPQRNAHRLPTVDLQQTKDRSEKKRLPAAVSSLSHTETCHALEERKLNDSQPTPPCAAKHDPECRALVTHYTRCWFSISRGSTSVKVHQLILNTAVQGRHILMFSIHALDPLS
ncbi:hypothetical protein JOQ06_024663 [Pogonophryne albipinna]|uniref:Uncharacterized protein n=1 Tax=Pogonophryne albipinna TaxID=1090488 RepID=A0AAD6F5T6_9TELE|nr:hypothetical protein JOQ06_024663 [Pogonophryne albipinna]